MLRRRIERGAGLAVEHVGAAGVDVGEVGAERPALVVVEAVGGREQEHQAAERSREQRERPQPRPLAGDPGSGFQRFDHHAASATARRQIFPVVDVAADVFAGMARRHRNHGAQEAVAVREEIEVRVERVDALALARHHDDEPAARDAAQLGDGVAVVEDVLDHMGADHGVEALVGKRQVLDPAGHEFDAGADRIGGRDDVDAHHGTERLARMLPHMAQQRAGAAADVADARPQRVGGNAIQAGARIVGVLVHARMRAVELAVLLRGEERRRLAEFGQRRDVLAPGQRRRELEQRGVAHDRRQKLFQDEPDLVGLLAPHGPAACCRDGPQNYGKTLEKT